MNPYTLSAALHAAGAAVKAVDLVMKGEARMLLQHPPAGTPCRFEAVRQFLSVQQCAVAAAHALSQYGLERVAIADFDVHHGNGTDEIFTTTARDAVFDLSPPLLSLLWR